MSSKDGTDVLSDPRPSDRYVFLVLVLIIAGLFVTLPFTLRSLQSELFNAQVDVLYGFPDGEPVKISMADKLEKVENFYNITILDVNESEGGIDIALSGNRQCEDGDCPALEVTLIAYNSDVVLRRGLPPAVSVAIAKDDPAFSERATLPVVGWASQYPFDRYHLRLGVAFAETRDGKSTYLAADKVAGYTYGTIQNASRDFTMKPPIQVPPDKVFSPADPFSPAGVQDLELRRPTYLWVLSVSLVTLITVSSVLSLMSRSIGDALVGIGSLVLGVWGVRSVIVPSSLGVVTSIDISLSLVIMLLLFGLIIRSASHLRRRSDIHFLPRPKGNRP